MSTMNSNQKKEIPITKLEESTGVQVDAVAMNPQYVSFKNASSVFIIL